MRELFPSRTPFIPTKRTSSPLNPLVLPPAKSPISPKRMKFFLPPVTLLLKGK